MLREKILDRKRKILRLQPINLVLFVFEYSLNKLVAMHISKNLSLVVLLISISCWSQQRIKSGFGNPTYLELEMKSYEKDPEAGAVVLFESGDYHVELIGNYIRLVKEVHRKIKVFDLKSFEHSIVQIPYYENKGSREKVLKIKAITHNGKHKTFVNDAAIFDVDYSENWRIKRFTFPNIKEGSILEYRYRIESPYFFNFGDWEFQGDLPVIYSEFKSEISANFQYKRSLYGFEKLFINDVSIKKSCFSVPNSSSVAECEVAIYAMKDVPAFKEEKYMLAKKNFISRVSYELIQYEGFDGFKEVYTKNWSDIDRELRNDKDLGRQRGYKSYFKDKLPEDILTISDPLEKAKAIYLFVQKHFSWNGEYRVLSNIRVKEAFEEKTGNIAEINISLINALNAAGLDAKIALISTRDNGLPTLLYPVMTDFNYVIASLKINNDEYLLDATDKKLAFEILPFDALNVRARVMDFKKGSYWKEIEPYTRNIFYVNSQIKADENGNFSGKVSEVYNGYIGIDERNKIDEMSMEGYTKAKRSYNAEVEIEDFKVENLNNTSKSLKETYTIEVESETVGDNVYLNLLFIEPYIKENPFKVDSRKYPMDFGFPFSNTYLTSVALNNKYEVIEVPKNRVYKIPGDVGECSAVYSVSDNNVNMRINIKLNEYRFDAINYGILKNFFSNIILTQSKEPIVLKPIKS